MSQRMNSSLPIYALGGALGFCILSAIATKYRGEEIQPKHLFRDSTAGALFTAFVIVLIPDMFPQLSIAAALTAIKIGSSGLQSGGSEKSESSTFTSDSNTIYHSDDFELQVGYPKRK
jgi:hypothetical protein